MGQTTERKEKERVLNDLARFIVSSSKIRVILKADTPPCCDVVSGEVFLNNKSDYTENKALLIHESGHFLYTKRLDEKMFYSVKHPLLLKEIINGLEDERTEHKISKVIVLGNHYLRILETNTTKRISENNNGTIYIKPKHPFRALFFSVKLQKEHLKDLLKLEISQEIREQINKALEYYNQNEQNLFNGNFENMIKHSKVIYEMIKPNGQKGEDGDEGHGNPKPDKEGKEQPDKEDKEQPDKEDKEDKEQPEKVGLSSEKDGDDKGDGEEKNNGEDGQDGQEDGQEDEDEDEDDNEQNGDGKGNNYGGTIDTDDFKNEEQYKDKTINNEKVRDLDNSDLIVKQNVLKHIINYCKPNIRDLNNGDIQTIMDGDDRRERQREREQQRGTY